MSREKPEECDCCNFETKELKLFKDMDSMLAGGGKVIKADYWYCNLCSHSLASNAHRYPAHYADRSTMQTVCYVGNAILEALKKRAE